MKTFKGFLAEGGNIKIGEHSANNISISRGTRPGHQKAIHGMLGALHDSFHKETGHHLFGDKKQALESGSAYSGSTEHLMGGHVGHEEFAKHKPSVGDVDVKIPAEHREALHAHLKPGKKFGKYTVVGTKKSGTEIHALMKHDNGQVHQFDFENSHYEHNEPSKFDRFAHNSDWEDIKHGIKGMHHKVLLNATGGEKHKFSVAYGLGKREGDPHWDNDTHSITHKLFGKGANEKHLHSFHGVVDLIKKHIPASEHQRIYDKFKNDVSRIKVDHSAALKHMQQHLKVKD